MICYYGGKWRAAPHYPAPLHQTIVEPFAGAAGYASRYPHLNVMLYDLDPIIAGLWDYLIHVPSAEIAALPLMVDHIDNLQCCQEAKHLIGFWLNKGSASPCKTPSAWMRLGSHQSSFWGEKVRSRIAAQVDLIRHWQIQCADYTVAPDIPATWFIDPPYAGAGKLYRKGSKNFNFQDLGNWCRSRVGQVMVCENEGADWLPFVPMGKFKSTHGIRGKGYSSEAIYYDPQSSQISI